MYKTSIKLLKKYKIEEPEELEVEVASICKGMDLNGLFVVALYDENEHAITVIFKQQHIIIASVMETIEVDLKEYLEVITIK